MSRRFDPGSPGALPAEAGRPAVGRGALFFDLPFPDRANGAPRRGASVSPYLRGEYSLNHDRSQKRHRHPTRACDAGGDGAGGRGRRRLWRRPDDQPAPGRLRRTLRDGGGAAVSVRHAVEPGGADGALRAGGRGDRRAGGPHLPLRGGGWRSWGRSSRSRCRTCRTGRWTWHRSRRRSSRTIRTSRSRSCWHWRTRSGGRCCPGSTSPTR
jgi:hypothetical protein